MLKRRTIDVVVPIHDGHRELEACLASVQAQGGDYRLILIDDCSPDERIGALLRKMSATSRTVVLRNERALGFAASANRGMARGRNDVVLLGADTLVTSRWLDKMRRCAGSDSRIGTITLFSNDPGDCCFDVSFRHGAASDNAELINRAMELAAVPTYPDIPVMGRGGTFIRRSLIQKIGLLDEVSVSEPRGELVDFSLRARKAGYRNVLCEDTFVAHPGLRHEGGPGQSARESVAKDSIEPIRAMVQSQLAVLLHGNRSGVLHILHGRGGGTEKYVQELISATRDGFRHYLLRILPDRWRLTDINGPVPANYEHSRQREGAEDRWLASLCAWLHIGLAHVHSLVGSGDDLLQILDQVGLPYCYSVHDMYLACPTVYLIDSQGEYCNATTDNAVCRGCLSKFDAMEDTDIERWRHRYGTFLGKASKVFAPSVWARDTLTEYYPGTRVTLAPPWKGMPDHVPARGVSNGWALPNDECRHVGVLGAIGPEKGARHLDRLAARIRERGLPLRLVLVGYTDCVNRDQSPDRVLTIHGPYRSEEIEALFDYYGIAVVVFPSVWPETFSYTLGETWKAGRPALVPPVGALRERVAATGAGWIMDGWPDPDRVLDQLMTLTAPGNSGELARTAQLAKSAFQTGHDGTDPMSGYYADMLSDAIQNTGHVVSRLQILDAACRALGIERSTQPADPVSTGPVRAGASGRRLFRLFRG